MEVSRIDQPVAAAWWVSFLTRLPRYKFLLRKRWWVLALTVALGLLAAALRVLLQQPVYTSAAQLVVSGKVSFQENASYSEEYSGFAGTQIEWMKSEAIQHRAVERVLAEQPGLQPVPVKFDATEMLKTNIFLLTATGPNADYTQKYLKACIDEYLDARRELRSEKSESTLNGLTDQLVHIQKEVSDSEEELLNFQKQNNIGFIQEESSSAANYLVKLNSQLADLKTEYQLLDLLNVDQTIDRKQKQKPDDSNSADSSALPGNDAVRAATGAEADYLKAKQEIELLKAKRDELSKVLRPKHPDIKQLNEDIDRQETLINTFRSQTLDQLKSRHESLDIQIKNLQDTIKQWEVKALEMNEKLADYNRIKSKGDRAKANYDSVLASSRSVAESKDIDQEIVSVMEPPGPAFPVRPDLTKLILLGLVGGLAAGIGILLLLDKIDDRMNSFGEFQAHFKEDVLAKIPEQTGAETLLSFTGGEERFAFVESMRALRSSLFYMPVNGAPPKTFLVTSAVPNEGKTTIATNLAITMAFTGAKVLLIDGDLRRGTINEKFDMEITPGVGDVFKGTVPADKAARPTKIANLSLMARGANLEHPGENYLSKKADDLLKALYPLYDFIIIDSSPVLVADDTTSLAPKIDASIVVVRFSFSSARRSREAIDLLTRRQVNLIGVICNGVNQMMQDYYYNKYPEYYAAKRDV